MKRKFVAALSLGLLLTGCLQNGKVEQKTGSVPAPKQETQPAAKSAKPAKPAAVKPSPAKTTKAAKAAKKAPVRKDLMPAVIGTTNKSALSYQPGEEMVYSFKMDFASLTPGKWFMRYVRKGDDGKTFSGKVPADQVLTVKTSLDRPGFVSVDITLVDEKGKPVTLPDAKGVKKKIQYFAGTAVQPEKLTDCGEPADFDAFWARQKKRLAEVPFQGKVERKLIQSKPSYDIYEVSIPAPGPRPATGYLTIPRNAKPKSLPATLTLFGYSASKQKIPTWGRSNQINFFLNAHGQKLGQNDEYYKKFFASIRTPKYNYAFDPEQNKNPETCFFNGMVLRVLRALEYLKSLPEWNGKTLTAIGGSQGGLQAIWAGALDPDVTNVFSSITWCCDLAGNAKAKRLCGSWRIKYVPGLDYYDPVFMAKRIKKACVTIPRAGLGDYVCPPSGLMILYKNLATPDKSIRWVQGSTHGFTPKKSEVVVWATPQYSGKK